MKTSLKFNIVTIAAILIFLPLPVMAELLMSVSGSVVSDDSTGVIKASVYLLSEGGQVVSSATTNANGAFKITDVPKGSYALYAKSNDKFIINSRAPEKVIVSDGKNVVGCRVKLERGSVLKGKLLSDSGISIPSAKIVANGTSATSDALGNFELAKVPMDSTTATIVAPGVGSKSITIKPQAGSIVDMGVVNFAISPESTLAGVVKDEIGNLVQDAIVVAFRPGGSSSYTTTLPNGKFFIVGLDANTEYEFVVLSSGYEPKLLNDVRVPATNLTITLTANTTTVASLRNYALTRKASDVEGFYIKNVVKAASACNGSTCPDGEWGGVTADLTFLLPAGVLSQAGGSFSVGMYRCFSSSARVDFYSICKYYGASNAIVSASVGISEGYCFDSCCSTDLLGPSTGGMIGYGVLSLAGDFSPSSNCIWFSQAIGLLPASKVKSKMSGKNGLADIFMELYPNGDNTAGLVFRNCDTDVLVNFVEYYAEKFPWLKSLILASF